MNTCSQLTVKQKEDKGKATHSDTENKMLRRYMKPWRLEKHMRDDL